MINHFELVREALSKLDHAAIERAIEIIRQAKERGSMVFICGNGGSAATASHFACDLQKAAGVRAIALTDNVPLITAWANDEDYAQVFIRQLNSLVDPNDSYDVAVLLSCSGMSPTILQMIGAAVSRVVTIFGENGRVVTGTWTSQVFVPSLDYGVIEDVHLSICHAITKGVASE